MPRIFILYVLFIFLTINSFAGERLHHECNINSFRFLYASNVNPLEKENNKNLFDTTNKISINKLHKSDILVEDNIENAKSLNFKYAIILDIPVEETNNSALFQFIDEWLSVKYLFGGNSKNGIDCSSFSQHLLKEVYNINVCRVVVEQFNQSEKIKFIDLKQGDLIFFHTTRPGLSHVGVYLGNNKFIHASTTRGVVIDDLNKSYYKKAYRNAGRVIQDIYCQN